MFYRNGDRVMVGRVVPQAAFRTGKPELLFERPYQPGRGTRNWDASKDGRFVLVKESDQVTNAARINVVVNWFQELAQKAPAKR